MDVILSKNARKQYRHLPASAQLKIKKKLLSLQQNPLMGKKLVGELGSISSIRTWPYRILYEINEKENRIEVHKITHRQGAYK